MKDKLKDRLKDISTMANLGALITHRLKDISTMANLGALITLRLLDEKIILDIELAKATGVIIDAIMEFVKDTKEESK